MTVKKINIPLNILTVTEAVVNKLSLWDKDVFVRVSVKFASEIKELKDLMIKDSSFTPSLIREIDLFLDSFDKNALDIFFLSPLNKHQGIAKNLSLQDISESYCLVDYMDDMDNSKAFTKRSDLLLEKTEAYFQAWNSSSKRPIDIFFHLFNHTYKVRLSYREQGKDFLLYQLYHNLLDNIINTCIHCYFRKKKNI